MYFFLLKIPFSSISIAFKLSMWMTKIKIQWRKEFFLKKIISTFLLWFWFLQSFAFDKINPHESVTHDRMCTMSMRKCDQKLSSFSTFVWIFYWHKNVDFHNFSCYIIHASAFSQFCLVNFTRSLSLIIKILSCRGNFLLFMNKKWNSCFSTREWKIERE